jgi:predicted RNA binding protein YcfA (HicA-like mRNA interferase family)
MFVFVGHDPHQRPWVYHLPSVGTFGAVKWRRLRRILEGEPLGYRVTRPTGSHRTMEARGRPTLHLSFHDNQELPGGLVRKILLGDVGLTEAEALKLL